MLSLFIMKVSSVLCFYSLLIYYYLYFFLVLCINQKLCLIKLTSNLIPMIFKALALTLFNTDCLFVIYKKIFISLQKNNTKQLVIKQ